MPAARNRYLPLKLSRTTDSSTDESSSEELSSQDEDVEIASRDPSTWERHKVPGYKDSILPKYYANGSEKTYVSCEDTLKVYIDCSPLQLDSIDDTNEVFGLIFTVNLWWIDPDMRNVSTKVILRPSKSSQAGAQEVAGTLLRKYSNGDIKFKEDGEGTPRLIKARDYIKLRDPIWDDYFYPVFTFINIMDKDEDRLLLKQQELKWSSEKGSLVQCKLKYNATFRESLELHTFPLDRQVLRVKITAEAPIETFQFVVVNSAGKNVQVPCGWSIDNDMQNACSAYARIMDHDFLYRPGGQRSCVNMVLHVERDGAFYFHNILTMVFLVTLLSCGVNAIPADAGGERLGLLSTCVLAVLAYRYIVNELIPKKPYLTRADKYIVFTVLFMIVLAIQSCLQSMIWRRGWGGEDGRAIINTIDDIWGGIMIGLWFFANGCLYFLWKKGKRTSWTSVYQHNQEPYCVWWRCNNSKMCRPALNCAHASAKTMADLMKKEGLCECAKGEEPQVQAVYHTPLEVGYETEKDGEKRTHMVHLPHLSKEDKAKFEHGLPLPGGLFCFKQGDPDDATPAEGPRSAA
uniref:Neurotransmitter-gated ion-channel ligand-binding domain-containing protein n=1 Tax=Alexandrium andersonii TaxID=327968 RepID=A0A7S2ME05_9DINO|mmetsp:Transcript_66465/g.149193  ORF Transcript_66465/g.149193 Transcript_66465/m.149193 type:complete len:574 (+) Transcript_66465:49-1770(+)